MPADKNILIGVTGGIAAYKSAQLVRELKKRGANVRVMMTDAAQRFVAPLTFETLSENKVALDLFGDDNTSPTTHIEWARWPDLIVICPATANTIAKIANGFADNIVTTTVLATTDKVLLCPAMNVEMFNNALFQRNVATLKSHGYYFINPGEGELACGEVGKGRLPEPEEIVAEISRLLYSKADFAGKKLLVTAGPTHEAIDPVRYITNRSSGKMGYALAGEAARRGADTILISGPTHLPDPENVQVVKVKTAAEMAAEVKARFDQQDILIMAAAVADYRPRHFAEHKLKKSAAGLTLELEPTEDILSAMSLQKARQFIVGFALETENEVANAIDKLERKNCDLIILNNPLEKGAGFEVDTNRITLIDRKKNQQELGLMSKRAAAEKILDAIKAGLLENE